MSVPQEKANLVKTAIESFVPHHYAEDIKAADIARHLRCSAPQVFRYTKKYYDFSSANYVNSVRLQQAALQLKTPTKR